MTTLSIQVKAKVFWIGHCAIMVLERYHTLKIEAEGSSEELVYIYKLNVA
jgi:hypothetical protein